MAKRPYLTHFHGGSGNYATITAALEMISQKGGAGEILRTNNRIAIIEGYRVVSFGTMSDPYQLHALTPEETLAIQTWNETH